jgi:hypothetical protein
MALDEVREVEARITRRLDDPTLVRGLLGGTSVEVLDVKVGSVMKLELVGDPDAFGITRIASPVQAVVESRHTRWIWTVRAKRAGSYPLLLRASVRIPVSERGKDATHDIVVYTAKVHVRVSPWRLVRDFTGANWQWLAGTLLIPGVAWVIRGRRRQTESPAPKASVKEHQPPGSQVRDHRIRSSLAGRRSDRAGTKPESSWDPLSPANDRD